VSMSSPQIEKLKFDITGLSKYTPGWDGMSAKAFSKRVIQKALNTVSYIEEVFHEQAVAPSDIDFCPLSDGRVDMSVSYEDRQLILTIDSTKRIEVYYEAGQTPYDVYVLNLEDLEKWLMFLIYGEPT
jgi:hypothetical protein